MKEIFKIINLLNKGYSLLRVLQIIELDKINFNNKDFSADLGSLPNKSHNISSIKKLKNIKYFNLNIENESQKKNTVIINFEKLNQNKFKNIRSKFDKVLLFNVLEHIYDYKNTINFSKYILKKKSWLIGSTPFMFRIHGSPFDYYRFTNTLLEKELKSIGFKKISIKPLGYGIFTMFLNSIMVYNKYIPFLNTLLFLIMAFFDKILNIFSKGNKSNYPIGYFFSANKK
jgi:hypothetical protein